MSPATLDSIINQAIVEGRRDALREALERLTVLRREVSDDETRRVLDLLRADLSRLLSASTLAH